MGHDDGLKINIGIEDNINHFNWCWMETIKNFKNEEKGKLPVRMDIESAHFF
jgi:hypothetical protein